MVLYQTVVIKLPPSTDNGRAKAMQIAAATGVVTSVSVQGPERDHLVVVGLKIDTVGLTQSLRKKFKKASIISVQSMQSRSRGDYDDGDDGGYMDSPIDHGKRRWRPSWSCLKFWK